MICLCIYSSISTRISKADSRASTSVSASLDFSICFSKRKRRPSKTATVIDFFIFDPLLGGSKRSDLPHGYQCFPCGRVLLNPTWSLWTPWRPMLADPSFNGPPYWPMWSSGSLLLLCGVLAIWLVLAYGLYSFVSYLSSILNMTTKYIKLCLLLVYILSCCLI